ncbi:hypothetical protein [Streptomyces sp. NBC_01353]|uniref:hypothetical protein n=1 Tax=Streptomyces sp. NBC_01353 TaxID=2903835 RepID=UPI002E3234E1|nr:hypothetical protein [Streptomyces sp. NBC_01353]
MRHPRLTSDAKILVIYVQGLPGDAAAKPLGAHAADLGMKPRAYQKAKESLAACGYYFEWKWQGGRGHWVTEQLLSNVTLTREEANAVRDDVPPSLGNPAVGSPGVPKLGSSKPVEEDREKTSPHPPTKEPQAEAEPEPLQERSADPDPEPVPAAVPERATAQDPVAVPERATAPDPVAVPVQEPAAPLAAAPAPEVAAAERLLLSLRHANPVLSLGVREARGLAEAAAEWFRRGFSAAELRHALTSGLPSVVRSPAGFIRHRLTLKMPAPAPQPAAATPGVAFAPDRPVTPAEPVICDGPGGDHAFRPVAGETSCGPCRTATAARHHPPKDRSHAYRTPWRLRVQEVADDGRPHPDAPGAVGLAH